MIKAILFDIDGVLLDSFEANLKFLHDLFTHFGYEPVPREWYKQSFHMSLAEVVHARIPDITPEDFEKIRKARADSVVKYASELAIMPPQAADVITELAASYKLGIVSSRQRVGVFSSSELKALEEKFSVVVAYEDTKNHKPHAEPVLKALSQLELSADEVVYIGDARTDLEAARGAGTYFIQFVSTDGEVLTGVDGHVKHFKDIDSIVRSI